MKYDAIVDQGISIHERVPIPERLIPEDSRVEIDAKIYAGYFTNEKVPSMEELSQVHGRAWYASFQWFFRLCQDLRNRTCSVRIRLYLLTKVYLITHSLYLGEAVLTPDFT